MTITLDLPPDLEERLVAESKSTGLPVEEVIMSYLRRLPPARVWVQPSTEEMDRMLDEAAALIPDTVPPLSDEAISRENIYSYEEDWKG